VVVAQKGRVPVNTPPQAGSILRDVRRRLIGWIAARAVLMLVTSSGALALAACLVDATLELPDHVRALALPALGTLAGLLGAAAWMECRRLQPGPLARRFEERDPALGSRLTNAVQLAQAPAGTGVGEHLRGEVLALGLRAAGSLRTTPLARPRFLRALAGLGGTVLAWALAATLARDLLHATWPRFTDPHGDHPPYSPLQIEVRPRGGTVLYGDAFEVRASASGRPVDKLWLVARSKTNETRAVMFLAPDRSFFQTLSNLREDAEYFVTDGRARSHRFPITVRLTPRITGVEVTTRFPEYTGLPERTAKLPEEPQALPAGTLLTFRVASNRPLRSGRLTLTPLLGGRADDITLTNIGANLLSGGFTLREAASYQLDVTDTGGLDSREPRQGRLLVRPDEKPAITVLEPARDAVATPTFRVPIRVQATDDYGVTRVAWLRGHNGSTERPFAMKTELKRGASDVEAAGAFDLAKLGVKAGDVIEYYFEAADNDPAGPNLSLSKLYRLEIISDAAYEAILRESAARQALFDPYLKLNAWMQRLAEQARSARALAEKGDPGAGAAAQRLADELEALKQGLADLLEMPELFAIESSFRDAIRREHALLDTLARQARQAAANQPTSAPALAAIARALEDIARDNTDSIGTPARHLASVAALLARADIFVKLARDQSLAARLLKRFANRTDTLSRIEQLELQEIAHQERRIREALRSLMESLAASLSEIPGEPPYEALRKDVQSFVQAVADAGIDADLKDAAASLARFDPGAGHALAQSAADKMERLVSKCESQGGVGARCLEVRFKPRISGMSQALGQILQAMGTGDGGDGNDGYSMFSQDVGLYGPNRMLAGEQAGGRGNGPGAPSPGRGSVANDPRNTAPGGHPEASRVHLQPDARFPLRYRDLVGGYFRAIADATANPAMP
jgi:hypothetical protein